jgi:endoglucanase
MRTIIFYLFLVLAQLGYAGPSITSPLIKVDQFGYRLLDQKIAVISIPQVGYNAPSSFVPGATYQVRNWTTNAIVFSGAPVSWNAGATHAQSGDKAYWLDFSALTTAGSYYIFDPTNNVGSYRFEINDNVYNDVLKHATRMLYYQRCGAAKLATHAQAAWSDGACHAGALQDKDCRLYNDSGNAATAKDLSGGWHDAGDYNKYVNFTYSTMMNLLLAYKENPSIWPDNYNIPESGNGVPDLLDEIKVELEWLKKMQNANGSVLSIVGVVTGQGGQSPPTGETVKRVYGPATTSASYSTAGIFGLAAVIYKSIGQTTYAADLQTRAASAYNWAVANPSITFNNAGAVAAGEQEVSTYESSARKLDAAIFLYDLTSTATYKTYIDANYTTIHLMVWGAAYPFETSHQDALLYYASLANATPTVATAIKNTYTNSMSTNNADNLPNFLNNSDVYRAYIANNNWTWNSNQTKSSQGMMFSNMVYYNLNTPNTTNYKNAASGFVHYFHGVNPNGKTFLSNMGAVGAENSVSSFYHGWFANGSALWDEVGVSTYGPPPGFIPGGPNPSYALDVCCPSGCGASNNAICAMNVSPPSNQPIQKSYKDFNDGWPLNSWTITEPGIYTNAAYIRLLSKFATSGTLGVDENEFLANNKIIVYPSPAGNEVTISFAGISENNFSLAVIDLSGKLLEYSKINLLDNNRTQTIDVSHLSSGIYLFKIQGNGFAITKRVVKQ